MQKLRIIAPVIIAIVVVSVISLSVALAQENERGGPNASRLAIKVAEILRLDAVVVDDAINQARKELRDEAIQKKLKALVEKNRLTEEQASGYHSWIQSRPEGKPGIEKDFLGKKAHTRGWKSHGGFFGSRNYFNGESSFEDIQQKLKAMVEGGDITQEEAEAKLKALEARKSR